MRWNKDLQQGGPNLREAWSKCQDKPSTYEEQQRGLYGCSVQKEKHDEDKVREVTASGAGLAEG